MGQIIVFIMSAIAAGIIYDCVKLAIRKIQMIKINKRAAATIKHKVVIFVVYDKSSLQSENEKSQRTAVMFIYVSINLKA